MGCCDRKHTRHNPCPHNTHCDYSRSPLSLHESTDEKQGEQPEEQNVCSDQQEHYSDQRLKEEQVPL